MLKRQKQQQQLQILNQQHNNMVQSLHELIRTLQQQYQLAVQTISVGQQYGPTYSINLGLIHSLINNIDTATQLVNILRNNPADWDSTKLSIYLIKDESIVPAAKPSPKQQIQNIQQFIAKHKYSIQIELPKLLMRESILHKIQQKCTSIYNIKLQSDQYQQKNQIEDNDLILLKAFQNISILQLKQSAITDNSIQFIRDKMHNIKQLNLTGCYMLTDRGIKVLSQCNLVTIIMNGMNSLKDSTVVDLIRSSANLNYLQIKQCPNISQTIFIKVYQAYTIHQSSLKWLQLNSDHGIDLYVNKLTYLTSSNPIQQITDHQIKTLIGQHSPNYTGIFFLNCQQLTKQSLQIIIIKCKQLERLALSKFINLTDRLVQDLSLSLPLLVFLDLNCCDNITNNGLYYIANNLNIQYLILMKCHSITDQGLAYILKSNTNNNTIVFSPPKKKAKSIPKREKYIRIPSSRSQKPLQLHLSPIPSQSLIAQQKYRQKQSRIKLKYLNIAYCNKITDQSLILLCHNAAGLQYLNLQYCDQITDVSIENISEQLQQLQYLNLNHCQGLTDSSISMLATRLGKRLKVLELQWCQISQNCVRLIAQNLNNLQVLNLSYCPAVVSQQIQQVSRNLPKLHTLKLQSCNKIKQHAFIKLASLRQLKIVCLKQCVQASDTFIKLLTTNNKYLQHLDISWCTQVTDKGLFSIAKSCYNLKYLNLNGCVQITDQGIQWLSATVSQIQYLNLTLCSRLTDSAILQITQKMKNIKYLSLCELELLSDISIATISNLQKLQQLMLMGCIRITNSSLIGLMYNLAKLNQLNINQCKSVQGKQLLKICQFMQNIKVLQISQIQINDQFLDQLATYCQKLTYINLCYCNDISDQAVLKLLQRIPRLQKIDIQNTNITERTKSILVHALNARRMANIVLK